MAMELKTKGESLLDDLRDICEYYLRDALTESTMVSMETEFDCVFVKYGLSELHCEVDRCGENGVNVKVVDDGGTPVDLEEYIKNKFGDI